MNTRQFGFTLIELIITVAILGIIAAIAIPNYQQYILRSNRVDAKNALLKIASEQEKYYLQNNTYFDNTEFGTENTAKGWFKTSGTSIISSNGFYSLTITTNDSDSFAQNYLAKAVPVTGGRQANDKDCAEFTINGSGQRSATPGTGGNADKCW